MFSNRKVQILYTLNLILTWLVTVPRIGISSVQKRSASLRSGLPYLSQCLFQTFVLERRKSRGKQILLYEHSIFGQLLVYQYRFLTSVNYKISTDNLRRWTYYWHHFESDKSRLYNTRIDRQKRKASQLVSVSYSGLRMAIHATDGWRLFRPYIVLS